MQLLYYIRVLRAWAWLLLMCTLLSSCTTYLISSRLTPTYQASTLLQINSVGTTDSSSVFANQALAVSYALLITSHDVLLQVSQRVPGTTLALLQANVSASPEDNTQIIQIRANADTPQKAALIANITAQTFISLQIQKATAPLQALAQQLTRTAAAQKKQLDADTTQLAILQAANAPADQLAHQHDIINNDAANYNTTLATYQQIQLKSLQAASTITQVQAATPPDTPTSPHPLLNTLAAAALSLLLSITLALLLDWADTTLKTPEDVSLSTQLPSLGSITFTTSPLLNSPFNEHKTKKQREHETIAREHETIARDFIAISTTFCKQITPYGQCAVTITAIHPHAGATTTATHLALSLTTMGKRVLLVDANIRNPSLHTIFHCQNSKGLTNTYQLRTPNTQLWLQQWATIIPNLWLLPAGPTLAHPHLMLRSPELSSLIAWLLGQQNPASPAAVDFILFDTQALTACADTLALTSITSTTLLVIKAGKEHAEMLHTTNALLQRMGTSILGVVVNRQTLHHYPSIYTTHFSYHNWKKEPNPDGMLTPNHRKEAKISPLPIEVHHTTGSRLFSKEKEKQYAFPVAYQPIQSQTEPIPPRSVSGSAQFASQLFKSRQFIRH